MKEQGQSSSTSLKTGRGHALAILTIYEARKRGEASNIRVVLIFLVFSHKTDRWAALSGVTVRVEDWLTIA